MSIHVLYQLCGVSVLWGKARFHMLLPSDDLPNGPGKTGWRRSVAAEGGAVGNTAWPKTDVRLTVLRPWSGCRARRIWGYRPPAVVRQWLALFGGSPVVSSGVGPRRVLLSIVGSCWGFNCRGIGGWTSCLVMPG